jgi:rhodanese-related sulfurtransferase
MRAAGRTPMLLAVLAASLGTGALVADLVAPVAHASTIEPLELARWIRHARPDLDVIDIRPPVDYEAGHIPTARNAPHGSPADPGVERGATVVLYGPGGVTTDAAIAAVSSDADAEVLILERGIEGWVDDVMAPRLPDDASAEERAAFAEQSELSRWFGGLPRIVPAASMEAESSTPAAGRSTRLLSGC